MIVIPAIDLLGGLAVRLEQGDYDRVTAYDAFPGERARAFVAAGAERIHVVDLEGARDGRPRQQAMVERIVRAAEGAADVQVGGGLRTLDDARSVLATGVRWVVMGTSAVRDPDVVRRVCQEHPGAVIVAIDAKGGRVAVEGWAETTEADAVELARSVATLGAAAILYTDIARDGMRQGPNVAATAEVAGAAGIDVLASGGVGKLEDLRDLSRARPSIAGVVVGRALYVGAFGLAEAIAAARDPKAGEFA